MQVQDFPRPRNNNRRGVHWSTILYPAGAGVLSLWIAELQQLHVKWVKILDDGGGSSLPLCEQLLAADIFPIVRLYRQAPNPGHLGGRETDTVKQLARAGCVTSSPTMSRTCPSNGRMGSPRRIPWTSS